MGLGVRYTHTRHHIKTLAATYSRPNPETLVARVVLVHPRVVFHLCTCGLCEGAVAIATALISYDDMGLLP
jgi:hypothetical protein